jgi:CheY-like chemotaxis protein
MYKVLIVDDNSVNIFLTKVFVQKVIPNAMIFESADGKTAVNICNEHNIDLIFMDVQMPEMNGYETTKAIRANAKNMKIPIIGLTAGVLIGEKEKCLEAGMNAYYNKPLVKENVEEVVSKWLVVSN